MRPKRPGCVYNAGRRIQSLGAQRGGEYHPVCNAAAGGDSEIATRAAEAHRRGAGHPDEEFVREHFSWKSKHFGQTVDVEPECLWGSHASESFLAAWGRELGVASPKTVRLQPEAVCVSALEPPKLRAAARSLK